MIKQQSKWSSTELPMYTVVCKSSKFSSNLLRKDICEHEISNNGKHQKYKVIKYCTWSVFSDSNFHGFNEIYYFNSFNFTDWVC